jgi:hypothetical protein
MNNVNTDQLAVCPSCGAAMHLSRIAPSFGGLPETQNLRVQAMPPCDHGGASAAVSGIAFATAHLKTERRPKIPKIGRA